jgi:8-oxo-dGTP diphosphatase
MATDDGSERGSPRPAVPLGPIGGYVIENLTALRAARRLSYRELADRLEELGRPIPTLGLSRIEKGNRRVDADDLIALAIALRVNPSALLLPRPDTGVGEDVIELTPMVRASARDAWDWADGRNPLPQPGANGLKLADFEHHARPVWLRGGVVRASEIPAMRRQLEEQLRRLELLASAPPVAEYLATRPIRAEEGSEQPIATAIVTSGLGVLVGRRRDGDPPWGFIAGEIEPGESPAHAAVREVKEEASLLIEVGGVIGERVHPKTHRRMIYLSATPTLGTDVFVGDSDELTDVGWVSLAEADELMREYGMYEPVREHLARELGEGEQ